MVGDTFRFFIDHKCTHFPLFFEAWMHTYFSLIRSMNIRTVVIEPQLRHYPLWPPVHVLPLQSELTSCHPSFIAVPRLSRSVWNHLMAINEGKLYCAFGNNESLDVQRRGGEETLSSSECIGHRSTESRFPSQVLSMLYGPRLRLPRLRSLRQEVLNTEARRAAFSRVHLVLADWNVTVIASASRCRCRKPLRAAKRRALASVCRHDFYLSAQRTLSPDLDHLRKWNTSTLHRISHRRKEGRLWDIFSELLKLHSQPACNWIPILEFSGVALFISPTNHLDNRMKTDRHKLMYRNLFSDK